MKRATPIGGLPFWALLYAVVGLPVVDEASERPLGLQVDLIELSLAPQFSNCREWIPKHVI